MKVEYFFYQNLLNTIFFTKRSRQRIFKRFSHQPTYYKPRYMIDWVKNHPVSTTWIGTFLMIVIMGLSGELESSPPPKEGKYCEYPGCIRPPSGFLNAGTGYCNQHAQQIRDEQKILDKLKTQGY